MNQKYSFKELLTQEVQLISDKDKKYIKIDKIKIPMIQRDYAQGRKIINVNGEENLNLTGEKFIKEIFSVLENSFEMELDFIYGSTHKEQEFTYFVPLDGQQRLTTLFLLYWSIGIIELNPDEKKELAAILKNFYYETRDSATDFCSNLVEELNYDNIHFLDSKIIDQIKDLSWFHGVHDLDPTVVAMLNMLEKIQDLYLNLDLANNSIKLFNNLEKIRFYILPLSDFGLTEELYIKMNGRGKALTDFENFKADLQHWLIENMKSYNYPPSKYDGREMSYDMYFINKIDNEWLNCFWKQTKQEKNCETLFLKFIYRYFLILFMLNSDISNKKIDKTEEYKQLTNEDKYLGFDIFNKLLEKNNSLLDNFVLIMDKIANNYEDIIEEIQPCWDNNEDYNILTKEKELTNPERVFLSSIILYLKYQDFNKDSFSKWSHVVWNIVENANIDSVIVTGGAIKLIEELAQNAADINKTLANDSLNLKSKIAEKTIEEERIKAKLKLKDEKWIYELNKAEAHPFFKGSVRFLIPEDEKIESFIRNFSMAQNFFNADGVAPKYREENHIFLRALLSKYTDLSDIEYHITDKVEGEHSLKNMLKTDIVGKVIREWFKLPTEDEIHKKLLEEVQKDSPITNIFEKKIHEELYKKTDLINWMQEKTVIRYDHNNTEDYNYIFKPRSYSVLVYGYSNEIINTLIKKYNWICNSTCTITENGQTKEIPYYWSLYKRNVEVTKMQQINNDNLILRCSIGKAKISLFIGDNNIKELDYINVVRCEDDVNNFVEKEILPCFEK